MGLCNKISYFLVGLVLIQSTHAHDSPQDYLKVHNKARKEVGVVDLEWDEELANSAKAYAEQRRDCQLKHSGVYYGENLAWGAGDLSAITASEMWVAEKADYDYDSNSCIGGKMCRHYTQVIWRDTCLIGCHKVKCDDGAGTFIVCHYDPPGNYDGEKPY